ncbi:Predicted N-acyltransferase, GNAT family [Nitrosospira sp. Nl5]|uniref:GNAT family N-acetyltransferase n=1 Tax=Nitrosospira sp. Nl5 TaxID=200120 RepID=UPI00088ACE1F|nr:GNAT family N-acetyltransferase [Nitrosospira sp. Nl5]SCY34942.1 Predicted N-acyltransferase, GNAT family [Nitrosospira sp. Nl5]
MNSYTIRTASWQDDHLALRMVREAVFICEQHVPVELEWDECDARALHLLAIDLVDNPIATARLLPEGVIGRMAVLKEWRGRDVGGALLLRLLEEARKRQIHQITLSAQLHAVPFYAKFGFQITGEEFMDAGIPHVRMNLRLS